MSEENKALVRRFPEEAWNKGKPEATADFIAESCLLRGGASAHLMLKRAITNWHTGFPDFAFHTVSLVAEEDHVVAWTRFTGTHRSVFQHVVGNRTLGPWEPTGRTVDVPEVWMVRVGAGKIAEIDVVWGALEFIEQLGISALKPG